MSRYGLVNTNNGLLTKIQRGGLFMEKKQRSSSPIMWALKQTGEHRGRYVVSVVFAVVGVAFSLAPYFVIVDIVTGSMCI